MTLENVLWAVTTILVGIIGFFIKSWIDGVKDDVSTLRSQVGNHGGRISFLEGRVFSDAHHDNRS
jgi:hypothetical protein